MISRFSCHNFRNIQADNLEFEKINILIGPNNSGKSNFIKAITFFSEMLKNAGEGSLRSAFLNAVARNGWDHSLDKHADDNTPIDFSWDICVNGEPVRYRFLFYMRLRKQKAGFWQTGRMVLNIFTAAAVLLRMWNIMQSFSFLIS